MSQERHSHKKAHRNNLSFSTDCYEKLHKNSHFDSQRAGSPVCDTSSPNEHAALSLRSRHDSPDFVVSRQERSDSSISSGSQQRAHSRASSRHRRTRHRHHTEGSSDDSDLSDYATHSRKRFVKKKILDKDLKSLRDAIIEEKFGYSDESNPFGDVNLSAPFIWEKKQKLLKAAGKLSRKSLQPEAYLEQTTLKIKEIETVRKRREEREEEERLLEEQQAILARERELEHYAEWATKEEAFHRDMAQRRADIRIKQGRAKTSDLLLKGLRLIDGEIFEDLNLVTVAPHILFQMLSDQDARVLLADIQSHCEICKTMTLDDTSETTINWARSLEKETLGTTRTSSLSAQQLQRHSKFWESLLLLGNDVLFGKRHVLIKPLNGSNNSCSDTQEGPRDVTTGMATAALTALKELLAAKSEKELQVMEPAVTEKLKSIRRDPTSLEDPTYWEHVAEMLPYYKALAYCRTIQEQALACARLTRSAQAPAQRHTSAGIIQDKFNSSQSADDVYQLTQTKPDGDAPKTAREKFSSSTPVNHETRQQEPYWPVLLRRDDFDESMSLLSTVAEFQEHRQILRKRLIESRIATIKRNHPSPEQICNTRENENRPADVLYDKFVQQEKLSMEEDEFVMTPAYEIPLPPTITPKIKHSEDWDARYKPRKPRFFNRVKTGYEWSKYNQTHYDRDNPPPKAVQGYKFNIFYSDLIDPSVAPSWKILPGESSDTVMIQFHAGPPYEDIRFRIINREWDLHPKSGFKNTFDRGILQLHFNFKRYRYRR